MPVFADIVPSLNDLNSSIGTSNGLLLTWIAFMLICSFTLIGLWIVFKKPGKVRKIENN